MVLQTQIRTILATSLLLAGPALWAEGPPPKSPCPEDRECVGLVLAGGGARGAAHVGVLEVMEELHVPVDFIIGTSMGAIVGGMYASGVSPEQMQKNLDAIDWEEAFDDKPPRRNIPFRQKEDDDKSLFLLEFGFGKDGFKSPKGLVAGQKLNFILSSMLIHQSDSRSFDDLPIPFRATAVDLNAGELVVLDEGDLATAIRASMAFPGMFTPVELDDMMLVDGGVLRNLPIDVAQELGADRLIAIDVGSKLSELEGKSSLLKLVRRTINVMSDEGRDQQRELIQDRDLLIEPDLEGITAFGSFDEVDEAVERGREAALAAAEELKRFAVPADEYSRFLARQRAGTKEEAATIDRVEVRGANRVSPKRITRRLKTRPGEPLDLDVLREDLTRVYQIGEFELVGFAVERGVDTTTLVINVTEKSWGPWFYRLGATLRTTLDGSGRFTGNILLRRPNIGPRGGEWKSFVTIGDVETVFTEFYQPVDYGEIFFVAPRFVHIQNADQEFFVGDDRFLVELQRNEFGLDLGLRAGNVGQVRLGAVRGNYRARSLMGLFDPTEGEVGGYRARLNFDALDNANFPRYGTLADLELYLSRDELGADAEFDRLFANFTQVWRIGRWSQLVNAAYGDGLDSDVPLSESFSLGGFFRISGLAENQLRGNQMGIVRLSPYRKMGTIPSLFGGDLYLGGTLEAGNVWVSQEEDPSFSDVILAGSLYAGLDTLFGPVYVGFGMAEGGRSTWYVYLGRLFGAPRSVAPRLGR